MYFTFIIDAFLQNIRCGTAVVTFLLISSMWLESGCHMFRLEREDLSVYHAQFMDAWKTYLHCRSSDKPDEIRFDMYQLKHLANKFNPQHQAPAVLPSQIRSLFAPLPSRLAVDPREMVVACAIHGGQVAEAAGQPDLSRELFTSVILGQPTTGPEKHTLTSGPLID